MHIQTHKKACTQAHMCTQTQICMVNIKQRATPTQWRCAVLLSTVVWIYWLLCGVQIHPSYKSALSGLLRARAPVFWLLCVWASAPPLLSYPPTIIRGEHWERLGAWLAGSAHSRVLGCERGHLSRALRVSREGEEKGCKGLFKEQRRIRNTLSECFTGQGFSVKAQSINFLLKSLYWL